MSRVRQIDEIPSSDAVSSDDRFLIWQSGRTRTASVSQLISGPIAEAVAASSSSVTARLSLLETTAAFRAYTYSGQFTLDSRAFVDAARTSNGPFTDYNTGAVNAEFLDLTGTIPTTNPGAMRDGRFLMVRDRDDFPYEANGYRAITNALRVLVVGKADNFGYAIQSKDMHAGWFTSMGRTSGTGRGFSGILAEASQLGTGAATNEFSATNPDYSNEQAAYLAAVIGHVHPQKADANRSTNLSVAGQFNTCGYRSTAGIRMASVAETLNGASRPGQAMYGVMMDELTVTQAAISMPQSATGSVGTLIDYGANCYSAFDRASQTFSWVSNGKVVATATNAGWTGYTATISAASGALTAAVVNTARYNRNNSTVHWTAQVTITTNGTAAVALLLSLPFPVQASAQIAHGRDDATGAMLQGKMVGTSCTIWKYDNSYPFVNGSVIYMSGTYEAQPL